MRPHPLPALCAAVFVLAAALPPSSAAAGDPAVEGGSAFVVLQVGDVVPTFNGIMLRAKDLAGLKAGGEKEVDAVVPTLMERQGTFTAHTYKLTGKTEKVKVKLVEEPRTMRGGRWQLTRAGKVVSGKDGKPATFEGCVPNGDRRCFNGIAGVARNFIVVASGAAGPAPAPVPPAPGADFAGPFPWRSAPINDTANGVEHRKCKKAECSCTGDSCKGKRVNLYAVTKAEKADGTLKLTMTLDADNYLTHAGGKWNMCWNSGSRASVPVATMAGFPDSKFLPDATYWVKGGPAGADFKGVKKAEFSWTGSGPAKPKDMSPECAYGDSPEGAPPATADELDKKLDELFTNKVERAGADWVATTYGGKTGAEARKAFLEALKGPNSAAAVAEARGKVRKEGATHVAKGTPESAPFVGKRGVTKEDLQKYICDLLPEGDGGAAAPAGGATSARDQLGVVDERSRAAAASASDAGTRGTAQIDETVRAGAQNPGANLGFDVTPELKAQCAISRSRPTPAPGPIAGPGTGPGAGTDIPTPHGQQVSPDKEKPDSAAEDAKKKKDLQRMAIGAAGGAIVLGVFGFIFGGPIGAIAMAAIGAGIMAGVTYLNNNPIDK